MLAFPCEGRGTAKRWMSSLASPYAGEALPSPSAFGCHLPQRGRLALPRLDCELALSAFNALRILLPSCFATLPPSRREARVTPPRSPRQFVRHFVAVVGILPLILKRKWAFCPKVGILPPAWAFCPKNGHFAQKVGILPKKWAFCPKSGHFGTYIKPLLYHYYTYH